MRWIALALIGCEGGGADCETIPAQPGCHPVDVCCDDLECWWEVEGKVYTDQDEMACAVCEVGDATAAYIDC